MHAAQAPALIGQSQNRCRSPCTNGATALTFHWLTDALGRPFAFQLKAGEAADPEAYEASIGLPNRIERMFGHLKLNRAITTRYDPLENSFIDMVHLTTARYWLMFVHAA